MPHQIPCLVAASLVACAVTLAACGSDSGADEDPNPRVTTSQGTLVISSVTTPDTFPPGCTSGSTCYSAQPGYQLLLVWLTPADGTPPSDLAGYVSDTFSSVSFQSTDGVITNGSGGGLLSGELFVMFTPVAAETSWTLSWPDNPPVQLPSPQ